MRNNIIVVQSKALYVNSGGTLAESHNIFWQSENTPPKYNFVQNWTMDKTSKLTNPKFMAVAQGDFRHPSRSLSRQILRTASSAVMSCRDGSRPKTILPFTT
jgi:hypothetical protein